MDTINYSDLAIGLCSMGSAILNCGGEIYRAEDTMLRIAAAYQVPAEVFVMPNCTMVTLTDQNGQPITRIQRIGDGSTDITRLEKLSALSYNICRDPFPETGCLVTEIRRILRDTPSYSLILKVLGFALGGYFSCLYCSGSWFDALFAALAAAVSGLVSFLMVKWKINFFISLLATSFSLGLVVYGSHLAGIPLYMNSVVSGALMMLLPGLAFTSFMTDMLMDDIISGLSVFSKTILTAVGLTLGTGFACTFLSAVTGSHTPLPADAPVHYAVPMLCLVIFLACLGFIPSFNIRGIVGILLCCFGSTLGCGIYLAGQSLHLGTYYSTFAASVVVSIYANVFARIRHFPVTTYLIVSYLPLVPGLRIYKLVRDFNMNDMDASFRSFSGTIGIAFSIAIGTLLVSTIVNIITRNRPMNRAHHL